MGTPDEKVVVHYARPSREELAVTAAWLVKQGVDFRTADKAFVGADKEGFSNNLTWRDALHRVVNRAARKNEKGWESYRGDWLELQKALKEHNL